MARELYCRLQLEGVLEATTPLHVGGLGQDTDTDLPLACDGAGRWYVPGTSLAGVLRSQLRELLGGKEGKEIEHWWGFQESDRGHASFILVDDAPIGDLESLPPEIRDGVGIDRQWGSAAEHIKYDRAVLPRGTHMPLRVLVEVPRQEERDRALGLLGLLLRELQAERIAIGAARTRGLGRVKLLNGVIHEQVLGRRDGLLRFLADPGAGRLDESEIDRVTEGTNVIGAATMRLRLRWKPIGPLMVKAGRDGIASDMVPLVSGVNGNGGVALVLPGSSIKGALRFHAERIVRTVLDEPQPDWLNEGDPKRRFLHAVRVPLVDELFGRAAERSRRARVEAATPDDDGDPEPRQYRPGRGALSVRDCYAVHPIKSGDWQAVEQADDDKKMLDALRKAGLARWQQSYHVAIDRWLGSAAESMLYTVLEPHGVEWEPIVLELDLSSRLFGEAFDLRLPGLALIFLLIRDLARGALPLGFATHRGMGALRLEAIEVDGNLQPIELGGMRLAVLDGKVRLDPPELLRKLQSGWTDWLERQRVAVRSPGEGQGHG